VAAAGSLVYVSGLSGPLERLSYDLPFILRGNMATPGVAMVFIDESSARALGQPTDRPWDRRVFARLVDRLREEGARLICFDLVFSTPSSDPTADEEFAQAMSRHGGVVLGGDYTEREQFNVQVGVIEKPTPVLRAAQASWGLLIFRPIDPDGAVREICRRYQGAPTLPLAAALRSGANVNEVANDQPSVQWLNYYGPAGEAFESVSIADVFREGGLPDSFFRDRTVFIGGRYSTGSLTTAKDEFGNPYSRWGRRFSPGVEIHATAYLNLLRGEWLRRFSQASELTVIVAFGLLTGAGLCFFRPHLAFLAVVCAGLLLGASACALPWRHFTWLPWFIPVGIQLPLALGWSVGAQYFTEQRRRSALRRAFSFYLSPELADRIASSDFDLRPGGKVADVTVIFTDLENFTTVSEDLDPGEASEVLIGYFEQTTRCILERRGTIIKYIGDAVFAAWGAPIDEPAHATKAAEAACELRDLLDIEVRGLRLRTRVGIHSGKVAAGNLGSSFRFDYTMIGDAVNFASRLESLNKYLGTQVLISDAACRQLADGEFVTRWLGEFRVAGKNRSVVIHELISRRGTAAVPYPWIEIFEQGVRRLQAGDIQGARDAMSQTLQMRSGSDGPATFYLRKIAEHEHEPDHAWAAVIRLDEK
jgi:adenylate cyclase